MAAACMLLTIGLPWLGAIAVWWIGDRNARTQHILASRFAIAAGITALLLLPYISSDPALSIPLGQTFGNFTFVPDGLGIFLAAIAAVIGSLAVVFSIDYMHGEEQLGRYYALVLFFIGAMAGLGYAGSVLLMFFFWEITAFCSYALISFHNDNPAAVAGGIKALIMTQLGGVGLLVGALVIRANLGSYQINHFLATAHTLQPELLTLLAFGFLVAAAAKSAQVPFQTWLPDAMEAPTPVTALIHAATMVNAGVYLLARFYPAFEAVPGWKLSVMCVGLISALLAALMAVVTYDLKRVLAYSTISQLGYMIYAVGIGGIFASQFHLLSHAVFKALLFLGAGAVIHIVGTRDMRRMGGLGRQMPFTRNVFVIGSLALAGLPIANGFFSKEWILEEGMNQGPAWAFIGMLIGAGLTALYTVRMVIMVYYGPSRAAQASHDAPRAMKLSLSALSIGVFTTWLLAGPFSRVLQNSLPFHNLHILNLSEMIRSIFTTFATWVTMAVILSGIFVWSFRRLLKRLVAVLHPLADFAEQGFGFEWLNGKVVRVTQAASAGLCKTQSGQLNLNVLGIVTGLGLVLTFLILGG